MTRWLAVCCLAGAIGCATTDGDELTTTPNQLGTEVVLFTGEHLYYDQTAPRMHVDVAAMLPEQGPYNTFSKITLELKLSCPDGDKCDWWDRPGDLWYLDAEGNPVEFARFMTPYRMGGTWTVDVTDLQTVLTGALTIRAHITTYVGPNINSQYGLGWIVDAKLTYEPGKPERIPVGVLPLRFGTIWYGEPELPTARAATIEVPEGVGSAGFYMLVTGHGQGNADNCAEFCQKSHTMQLGSFEASKVIWRDDCHLNPVSPQPGTWDLHRAGWCPGDMVYPWREELGPVAAGSYTVNYDVEAYENICRPGPICSGCVFNTGCDYDGGLHTRPRWLTNGFVILYRDDTGV